MKMNMMKLNMRSACATVVALSMAAAGCGNLALIGLNALLNPQTALDDDTPSDEPENANDNGSADNANENATDDDNDNATDDDDAGDNANIGDDDDDSLTRMDFSDFMQFAFSRTPGLGFCPPLDEVYTASISADPGGSQVLNLSVLREGIAGLDPCIDTFVVPCATAAQLEERTLTDAEATAVAAVFSAVQVDNEADPICETVAIDPCVINQFAWDSFVITDFECSDERLPPPQADAIISLLEQLRSGT